MKVKKITQEILNSDGSIEVVEFYELTAQGEQLYYKGQPMGKVAMADSLEGWTEIED